MAHRGIRNCYNLYAVILRAPPVPIPDDLQRAIYAAILRDPDLVWC